MRHTFMRWNIAPLAFVVTRLASGHPGMSAQALPGVAILHWSTPHWSILCGGNVAAWLDRNPVART